MLCELSPETLSQAGAVDQLLQAYVAAAHEGADRGEVRCTVEVLCFWGIAPPLAAAHAVTVARRQCPCSCVFVSMCVHAHRMYDLLCACVYVYVWPCVDGCVFVCKCVMCLCVREYVFVTVCACVCVFVQEIKAFLPRAAVVLVYVWTVVALSVLKGTDGPVHDSLREYYRRISHALAFFGSDKTYPVAAAAAGVGAKKRE